MRQANCYGELPADLVRDYLTWICLVPVLLSAASGSSVLIVVEQNQSQAIDKLSRLTWPCRPFNPGMSDTVSHRVPQDMSMNLQAPARKKGDALHEGEWLSTSTNGYSSMQVYIKEYLQVMLA